MHLVCLYEQQYSLHAEGRGALVVSRDGPPLYSDYGIGTIDDEPIFSDIDWGESELYTVR